MSYGYFLKKLLKRSVVSLSVTGKVAGSKFFMITLQKLLRTVITTRSEIRADELDVVYSRYKYKQIISFTIMLYKNTFNVYVSICC